MHAEIFKFYLRRKYPTTLSAVIVFTLRCSWNITFEYFYIEDFQSSPTLEQDAQI